MKSVSACGEAGPLASELGRHACLGELCGDKLHTQGSPCSPVVVGPLGTTIPRGLRCGVLQGKELACPRFSEIKL